MCTSRLNPLNLPQVYSKINRTGHLPQFSLWRLCWEDQLSQLVVDYDIICHNAVDAGHDKLGTAWTSDQSEWAIDRASFNLRLENWTAQTELLESDRLFEHWHKQHSVQPEIGAMDPRPQRLQQGLQQGLQQQSLTRHKR